MRVMITGGGTGGHTSPAVAVVEELQKRDPRLLLQWVGRSGGIEERLCTQMELPFRGVPVEGWPRRAKLRRPWVALKLAASAVRSFMYIKRFRPQVVFGVGGYVSLPLCYVAQRLGIPTVIHEQNKFLGVANRVLAPRATRILLSYPDTLGAYPKDKARVVGNPVRAGFANPPEMRQARLTLGLDPYIPVVLVCGGSQGAHTLNAAMHQALPVLSAKEVQFIWMTGVSDLAEAREAASKAAVRVEALPFIQDMVTACAAADFIVSRAGASSTAEIAMLGKPSLLVPYPHATDNHQDKNARAFETAGAAMVLNDQECTGARLVKILRDALGDSIRLSAMGRAAASLARPGAAEAIVEEILLLAFERPEKGEVDSPNKQETNNSEMGEH